MADLEAEVMADVHLPTSHLQHRLSAYQALLPVLDRLAERVIRHGYRGARVLEAVYEEAKSGNTEVCQDAKAASACPSVDAH